jgi:hypothetical protein
MQIAINTGSLSKETPRALERAADLGFRQVEVNLQPAEFGYGYRRKPSVRFYRQLNKQIDTLTLSVCSVTSSPQQQEHMFSSRARKEILINGIGAADLLGAQVFVSTPTDLFESEDALLAYFEAGNAPPVIKDFDEAWTQAINRRMTPVIRNYDYWMGSPLVNQADRLKKLTDSLAIGCALDIRLAQRSNPLSTWIEAVGDRLAVAYTYDVDEVGHHIAPISDYWGQLLEPFKQTRLKTLVISAGKGQGDEEISASRVMLQKILGEW